MVFNNHFIWIDKRWGVEWFYRLLMLQDADLLHLTERQINSLEDEILQIEKNLDEILADIPIMPSC